MRSSKYNLNGMIFSLLDVIIFLIFFCCYFNFICDDYFGQIEHGILRNASTKALVFGPLTLQLTFTGFLC